MRDYIQRTRDMVSKIVTNPIDKTTQVHVLISGMNPGFQRFYLTRKPPASLEEAFTAALREDYSVLAASKLPQASAPKSDPNAMEIDAIKAQLHPGQSKKGRASGKQMICFRCRKPGHRAAECRAPAPAAAGVNAVQESSVEQPKNEENQ
jgi:hypothetical protein